MKILVHAAAFQAGLVQIDISPEGLITTTPINEVKSTNEICLLNGNELVENLSKEQMEKIATEVGYYAAFSITQDALDKVKKRIEKTAEQISKQLTSKDAQA